MAGGPLDAHLDGSTLRALALGRLSDEDQRAAESHLEGCGECRRRFQAAEALDATLHAPVDVGASPVGATLPASPSEVASLAPGARVGRYVIERFLGAGAMGAVYAAHDPQLDRRVAIKLLRGDVAAADKRAALQDRLAREAQAMARLQHPNVVTVFDAGPFGDGVFIAMQLVEGETLAGWLARGRSTAEVVAAFRAAGSGLCAAHAAGVVHRDFKPDNVLVDGEGRVRVGDFGLARTVELANASLPGDVTQTAHAVVGTPAYMAPEQLTGRPASSAADVFSFAIALYQGLYGERPFAGETIDQIFDNVIAARVRPPPRDRRVPRWLRRVVLRGLQADPSARPTMAAFVEALGHDPRRARRAVLATAGLLLVAGVAATVGLHVAEQRRFCRGAESELAGVWDATVKEKVRAQFAQSGLPYQARAFASVARMLDFRAQQWIAARTDACEAARVRHTQSEEIFAKRNQCLDERLHEQKQLVDELATDGAQEVDAAVAAVARLGRVDTCSNTRWLQTNDLLSTAERAKRQAILDRVHHIEVLREVGKLKEALAEAQALEPQMKNAPGSIPRTFALNLGVLYLSMADPEKALPRLHEAVKLAEARSDDLDAAHALIEIAQVVAEMQRKPEEAGHWADLAEAALKRGGGSADLDAMLRTTRCVIALASAKWQDSIDACKRASSASTVAGDRVESARAMANVAIAYTQAGRPAESVSAFEKARAIFADAEGEQHPETVQTDSNLGYTYVLAGRPADALPLLERAHEQRKKDLGPDHPGTAISELNRGEALEALARYPEAEPLLEHAARVIDKASAGDDNLVEALTHLGAVEAARNRGAEAVRTLERALAVAEKAKLEPGVQALTRLELARTLQRRDPARAHALALQAEAAFAVEARDGAPLWAQRRAEAAGLIGSL